MAFLQCGFQHCGILHCGFSSQCPHATQATQAANEAESPSQAKSLDFYRNEEARRERSMRTKRDCVGLRGACGPRCGSSSSDEEPQRGGHMSRLKLDAAPPAKWFSEKSVLS